MKKKTDPNDMNGNIDSKRGPVGSQNKADKSSRHIEELVRKLQSSKTPRNPPSKSITSGPADASAEPAGRRSTLPLGIADEKHSVTADPSIAAMSSAADAHAAIANHRADVTDRLYALEKELRQSFDRRVTDAEGQLRDAHAKREHYQESKIGVATTVAWSTLAATIGIAAIGAGFVIYVFTQLNTYATTIGKLEAHVERLENEARGLDVTTSPHANISRQVAPQAAASQPAIQQSKPAVVNAATVEPAATQP